MVFSVDKVALCYWGDWDEVIGRVVPGGRTSLTRPPNRGLPTMAENSTCRVPYAAVLDSSGAMPSAVKLLVAPGLRDGIRKSNRLLSEPWLNLFEMLQTTPENTRIGVQLRRKFPRVDGKQRFCVFACKRDKFGTCSLAWHEG
ncbi:Uncharacterized protein HZ326_28891 [Fusarium oxysporum f. sp. albedinis]|nr:Uncharacterized protein HZ326_28891 [Fusarium oxysporum f. sp. albedinis]